MQSIRKNNESIYIVIGIIIALSAVILKALNFCGWDFAIITILIGFACATVYNDINKENELTLVRKISIGLIAALGYLIIRNLHLVTIPSFLDYVHKTIGMGPYKINLNSWFSRIPFNNGEIFRIFKSDIFTKYMRWMYLMGYPLCVIIPMLRSLFQKDILKSAKYLLYSHGLQTLLIIPFIYFINVQDVWYVLGRPDGAQRHLNPHDAYVYSLFAFPSMHTSTSVAILILALREKNPVFKYVWAFFCLSIIYSTLYLEIHWVIDVIGGIGLGYVSVKMGDKLASYLRKLSKTQISTKETLQQEI